tara:strand:+ start:609 stop:1598 length:990 start_codon:yes stop_codon:yes gene_type:complete
MLNNIHTFNQVNDSNNITDQVQVIQNSHAIENNLNFDNVYDNKINPFTEIVKVPLSTSDNGYSKAFSVRLPELNDREVGIVKKEYMAVSNLDIHKVGQAIRDQSNLQWEHLKCFFDGKVFKNQYICKDSGLEMQVPNMQVGDTIGIVMEEQNSYDSSVSAGIFFSFLRLLCTNGMTSKKYGFGHTFKHTQNNIDWEDSIYRSVNLLNGQTPTARLNQFVGACGNLQKSIDFHDLDILTHSRKYIRSLPTTQYGQIIRNMMISRESNGDPKYGKSGEFTAWDLLNSGTEILTHKNKPTQGNMRNNIIMTDGMLQYGSDKSDQETIRESFN